MRPQRMGRDFPTKQQHTCKASPVINNPHQSGPYVATHNNHPKSIVYIKIHSWCSIGEDDGPPLQYSCLENPMHGGAWWAAVHGVAKSQTRLSNFTSTFPFHALEKDMPTHSRVLAWGIPGTGEPGGLPSMGSQSRTRLKRLSSSSRER